tara:strand:- start:56 stop:3370 length:3315 start_codon:yes stop_codon:yes gene_type:complete
MAINKRLFGTPLNGKVREKLEERQRIAANPQPGESIVGEFTEENKIVNELGSRTPFVRMWTSVKIIDPAVISATLDEVEFDEATDALNQNIIDKVESKAEEYPNSQIIYSPEDKKYYIKSKGRDQFDYARQIYVVGDYSYQTNYGESDVNQSLDTFGQSSEITPLIEELLPAQLESNPYLKPQAGITSVSSNTEGMMGAIKKTTVTFTVHNFADFDKIYNKYFLKPGATIFVDFGWSSIKDLYRPEDLVNSDNISDFLYGEPEKEETEESVEETLGKVTESHGDLEVIQGIVTDYDAKILPNGSVECSVTLTSSNSALLGFETNEDTTRSIQHILNYGVIYLAVGQTLENSSDETKETKQFFTMPNANSSTTDFDRFNQNLFALAQKNLSAQLLLPKGNSVRTGIFINSIDVDDVYISFGLFEDLLINSQFGFGKSREDILKSNDFTVRIDSTNSFTKYHKVFKEKQKTLSFVTEASPDFLVPDWWGNSDPKDEGGSYNHQSKKLPYSFYPSDEDNYTKYDIDNERIPLRELFINTDIIITAFKENNNVRKVLNSILNTISEASDGVFDLQIIGGKLSSELTIADMNFLDSQQEINKSGLDSDNKNIVFENLFTFDIMSKGSIVTNYDLSFNLPSGNIGNMYAIQAMSHENSIFPLDKAIDEAVSINSLDSSENNPTENLSILYEPDLGGYRADQIASKASKQSSLTDVYENAANLLSNDVYNINTTAGIGVVEEGIDGNEESGKDAEPSGGSKAIDNPDDLPQSTKNEIQEEQDRLLELNNDRLTALGYKVVGKFIEYYSMRQKNDITIDTPTLLPFKLTLTIYGIASVVPGDTFRVNYLPSMYKRNVYLQTMKVSHNVSSAGWYTTLETQFRPRPEIKETTYDKLDMSKTLLSPKAIQKFKLQDYWNHPVGPHSNRYQLQTKNLYPYIEMVRIVDLPTNLNFINIILEFTWNGNNNYSLQFPYIAKVKTTTKVTSYEYGQRGHQGNTSSGGNREVHRSDKKKVTYAGYISADALNAIDEDTTAVLDKNGVDYPKALENNFIEMKKEERYYMIVNGDYWMIMAVDDDSMTFTDLDNDITKVTVDETFLTVLQNHRQISKIIVD